MHCANNSAASCMRIPVRCSFGLRDRNSRLHTCLTCTCAPLHLLECSKAYVGTCRLGCRIEEQGSCEVSEYLRIKQQFGMAHSRKLTDGSEQHLHHHRCYHFDQGQAAVVANAETTTICSTASTGTSAFKLFDVSKLKACHGMRYTGSIM